MMDENFDAQMMCEHMEVGELPIFSTGRLSVSRQTDKTNKSDEKENLYENVNIEKLLRNMQNEKDKRKSVSKKGWQKGVEKKEVRLMQLREEKDRKQLENCTFQPNGQFNKPKRTLDQFLEQQDNFVKKSNIKKQMMKQHLNEKQKNQFKPNVHSYQNPARKQKPIYERLYQLREKEQLVPHPNKEQRFRPSIGQKSKKIVREVQIGTHLYQDALRRQVKKSEPLQKQETEKSLNLTNQRYVAQKFIKQLYGALQQIKFQQGNQLDYLAFNELLYRLGFVMSLEEVENKSSTAERALVYEAFSLLTQTQPTIKNVCLFLLALIGIYHIDPVNFNGQEGDESLSLNLDEVEGRKLQKHFDLLYRNRLSAQQFRKSLKVPDSKVYTFKPQINPESQIMAENFRNKVLKQTVTIMNQYEMDVPSNRNMDHTDLLVYNKKGKQRIREEIRMQQEEKQLKQCTFKPHILEKKGGMNNSFQKSDKCFELYNLHKKRMSKDSQISEKPQDRECTFVPALSRKSRKSVTTVPRNSEKQVFRMIESRKKKEQINKFLERGYDKTEVVWNPKGQKNLGENETSLTSQRSEESPFLVIDVNLGSQVDHIVVYKTDINNTEELAESFALKHSLDEDVKGRLIDLLQQQISNVLDKIDEDDGSEHQ